MQLPILRIRTDNGTEFVNTEFSNYLDQECIVAERTIPYNPEQNGKIERLHRDTTEMTTKFLLQSGAPEQMWEYSHRYACTLKNRYFPHRSLQTTLSDQAGNTSYITPDMRFYNLPLESLPSRLKPHTFGCICFGHISKTRRVSFKFNARGFKCVFLGFTLDRKGYLLLGFADGQLYFSNHVSFTNNFPTKDEWGQILSLSKSPHPTHDVLTINSTQGHSFIDNDTAPARSDSESPLIESVISSTTSSLCDDSEQPSIENQVSPPSTPDRLHLDPASNELNSVDNQPIEDNPLIPTFSPSSASPEVEHPVRSDSISSGPTLDPNLQQSITGAHRSSVTEYPRTASSHSWRDYDTRWNNWRERDASSFVTFSSESGGFNPQLNGVRTFTSTSVSLENAWKDPEGTWKSAFDSMNVPTNEGRRNIPKTYEEAISCNDAELWKLAMRIEYDSLIANDTWRVIPLRSLPKGCKPISGKWVFDIRYDKNGTIEKYKARWVAKGFQQRSGRDFNETYAPVARMTSLRILLTELQHQTITQSNNLMYLAPSSREHYLKKYT